MKRRTAAMMATMLGLAGGATAAEPAVVPRPAKVATGAGNFEINRDTVIVAAAPAETAEAAKLRAYLRPATGFELKVVPAAEKNALALKLDPGLSALGAEGYRLAATPDGVRLAAAEPAGLFRGLQTLRQLLPPAALGSARAEGQAWTVPAVTIEDSPRFRWRGLMLDVGRHLFTVGEIKRLLDQMALCKFNTFHWHLTDDQGWRLEIRKYPRLTEVGAWRDESPMPGDRKRGDGKRYGGFYTQEQVKDIVAYAAERHITVVPEIEMPGHALGALTAYPELGCRGGPYRVRTAWGVEDDVFCAGNEKTFAFLQDVLDEVVPLFPGTFFHIGGDECPKARWNECPKCKARMAQEELKDAHELQSYFIQRVEKYLNGKGRRIIGWDEILEGGLAPNAAVMSWRGEKGGITAASQGHDVVMTPTSHAYLDYYQSKRPGEPEAIGGFVPLEKVYAYEPLAAGIPEDKRRHVLGFQGNLWTEYMGDFAQVQYMAWPRAAAVAEVAWSAPERRDYADFLGRLGALARGWEAMGVNYRRLDDATPPAARWKSGETTEAFATREWDVGAAVPGPGAYEAVFQYESGTHRLDIEWAELVVDGKPGRRDAHAGITGAKNQANVYSLSVPARPAGAKVLLRASVRSDGGADSNGAIDLRKK